MVQVLFAVSAGVLVKHYSVYAKHSGIPEIKTVLGGFVMRRFLGGWTLITKSLGLVSLFKAGVVSLTGLVPCRGLRTLGR